MLLQEPVDPADLFLVAGLRASIPRVEKIQEREGTLRELPLGSPQLAEKEESKLGSGRPRCTAPGLVGADGLAAGIAERQVALSTARVLKSQRLDEHPLALVVSNAVACPRKSARHRNQEDGAQLPSTVLRLPAASYAYVSVPSVVVPLSYVSPVRRDAES